MIMDSMELDQLIDNLKYGNGNMIAKNEEYALTRPFNSWDTNYRLYAIKEELTYLIDIDDIQENSNDLEEYSGILFSDLINLEIEKIKEIAWKTEKDESY